MKIQKFLLMILLPILCAGCDLNLELYNPDNFPIDFLPQPPQSDGKAINVINPSNYEGSISYAPASQELLTKEEVYKSCLESSVYIIGNRGDSQILGSGVFFSEDSQYGYLFTNAHVVEGLTNIEVIYSNYKRSSATLIGYNLLEDVAVLSVLKNDNYKVATIKTSDRLSVASEVLAIGTPAEIGYSFSANGGIISKIDSPISSVYDSNYGLLLIQTDTPLNNGNSGGPLFDMYGNLIGINSLKLLYDNSLNQIDDINFSIPMERAIFMANSFFNNTPYSRGKLGITIVDIIDLSLSEREEYNIDLDYGIFVVESLNSKFLTGDVITKINGISFTTKIAFQKELYSHYINEPLSFEVYRNNEYITINSTLN